jgi:RimJ/RimL family protein N-acetyltransferase
MIQTPSSERLELELQRLPYIEQVSNIKIKNNIIKSLTIHCPGLGKLILKQLQINDSTDLYDFYFRGLTKISRNFFPPYPLFSPTPKDPRDLARKIQAWKSEKNWTVLKLLRNKKIIGICLLKKYDTERPSSGLAVHKEFQKKGLGTILQTIINEQTRLLDIKKLTITLAPDNIASLKVHQKTGFKKTGNLVPHYAFINGVKKIDREDIEMVKYFDDQNN